jgi:hypothetical protein
MSAVYLSNYDVAKRYNIHTRTIPIWVEQGRLPRPHYFGRFPRFLESDLDEMDRATARERPRPRPAATVTAA